MKRLPYVFMTIVLTGAFAATLGPCVFDCREQSAVPATEALPGVDETAALRVVAKRQIARDVAAGRRTLFEGAALFRVLNVPQQSTVLSDDVTYPWALTAPCRTEDEQLCRQVVEWVGSLCLTDSSELAAAAVIRLNVEFRGHQRLHGQVVLPTPSAVPTLQNVLNRARATMTFDDRRSLFGIRD